VEKEGCGLLKKMTAPIHQQTKAQIVKHLKECDCPVINKILKNKSKGRLETNGGHT
jgi:hypothetical protein